MHAHWWLYPVSHVWHTSAASHMVRSHNTRERYHTGIQSFRHTRTLVVVSRVTYDVHTPTTEMALAMPASCGGMIWHPLPQYTLLEGRRLKIESKV